MGCSKDRHADDIILCMNLILELYYEFLCSDLNISYFLFLYLT